MPHNPAPPDASDADPSPEHTAPDAAPPGAAPPSEQPTGAQPADAQPSRAATTARSTAKWVGKRLIAHPLGKLAAVVVGALIGIAVQAGVESTGVLGPGIDALIERQDSNFAALDAKLEELRKTDDPARARQLATEIDALVAQQKSASTRMTEEIRGLTAINSQLRQAALEQSGASAGADVWLKPGESITVAGKPGNVFALNKFTYTGRTDDLTTNVSGRAKRMIVGTNADFPADDGVWRVIYKQAEARADGRVGFDVVFVPGEG